jgi:hypothetical protein
MKVNANWSLLGTFDRQARNSFFGMALSVFIAAETFGSHGHKYKTLMCVLVLTSAVVILARALKAKSFLGIATTAFSLIWIAPLFSASVFYNVDLWFMLAHSVLALAVAVGAFTYLKS